VRSGRGWRPAGAVALSASLWGLWWLPLRALAEAGLSGPALNAALYGIAGAALAPWLWRRRDRVAAGVLFALSVTLVRKGEAISGLEQTMVSFAAAALLSLLLLAATPAPDTPVGAAVLAWAALAALAWLLPCTWLLLWGARFLEPGRVSLLLLLEVAVAALSAALLAGEPFGLREAAGCLLILAAGALEAAAELRPARRALSALPSAAPSAGDLTSRND
jgi:hypothetical protein